MSTAGKVLVVLVMLSLLVWMVLAAGVAQLNTNANTKLHELAEQVEKLEVDLKQTQDDIVVAARPNHAGAREDRPRPHVLRAQQVDLEKARSQIIDTLAASSTSSQHVQETIKGAQTALEHRNAEQQEETRRAGRAAIRSPRPHGGLQPAA